MLQKIIGINIGVIVLAALAAGGMRYVVHRETPQTPIANKQTPERSVPGTQTISQEYVTDNIVVTEPLPETSVTSPLTVKGLARGTWYFEASFPLVLTDWDGRIIAQGYAMALDDWMTENFVPFEGNLEFIKPENIGDFSKRGALILQKDNPSGLPEYDDAGEFTVYFADK